MFNAADRAQWTSPGLSSLLRQTHSCSLRLMNLVRDRILIISSRSPRVQWTWETRITSLASILKQGVMMRTPMANFPRNIDFHDLRCACFIGKASMEVLLAGCQSEMFRIDLERGEILDTVRPQDT